MREKIEQIIDNHMGMTDSFTHDMHIAAAEIAKLFERKVIWEETLKLDDLGHVWVRAQSGYGDEGQYWLDHFLTPGQRVRVIVEEIDDGQDDMAGEGSEANSKVPSM